MISNTGAQGLIETARRTMKYLFGSYNKEIKVV